MITHYIFLRGVALGTIGLLGGQITAQAEEPAGNWVIASPASVVRPSVEPDGAALLECAVLYRDFFVREGIDDERARRVVRWLAAQRHAGARGELGQSEEAALRRELGPMAYHALTVFRCLGPGEERGARLVAQLRAAGVSLSDSETAWRELAARTVAATTAACRWAWQEPARRGAVPALLTRVEQQLATGPLNAVEREVWRAWLAEQVHADWACAQRLLAAR